MKEKTIDLANPKDVETLAPKFAGTVPEFQSQIRTIAANAKLPTLVVYGLWREYCESCRCADQSPVLFEFQQWYASMLTPTD